MPVAAAGQARRCLVIPSSLFLALVFATTAGAAGSGGTGLMVGSWLSMIGLPSCVC